MTFKVRIRLTDTNNRTMKKVFLVLAVVVISGMVLSSCGSSHGCPAYSKVAKVPAEQRG